MDEDADGVIKVDHVMKVIELLGTANAKLPAKEIRQIVEMLAKEDLLQVEENIEQSMAIHSEVDESFRIDAAYDQNLHDLETAAKLDNDETENVKKMNDVDMNILDGKYNISDNAKDLSDFKDTTNSHVDEVVSEEKYVKPEEDDADERKSAAVKLSNTKKGGPMDLK